MSDQRMSDERLAEITLFYDSNFVDYGDQLLEEVERARKNEESLQKAFESSIDFIEKRGEEYGSLQGQLDQARKEENDVILSQRCKIEMLEKEVKCARNWWGSDKPPREVLRDNKELKKEIEELKLHIQQYKNDKAFGVDKW